MSKKSDWKKETNSAMLKKKKKLIEQEIHQARAKINEHLDKIQDNIMKELFKAEEETHRKIVEVLTSLQKMERELDQYNIGLVSIKQHASEIQAFLAMKEIEANITEKEKIYQSWVDYGSLDKTVIKSSIDDKIQNLITNTQNFGRVTVETKPCKLVIVRRKIKQAQMMVPNVSSKGIDNVTLKLQQTINTGTAIGCLLLPNGKTVFSYYGKELLTVFNNDRSLDFHFKTAPSFACSMALIDKNTLALTSGGDVKKVVSIIDLEKRSIKKQIKTHCDAYGVIYREGELIICSKGQGIKRINLSNETITDLVKCESPMLSGITSWDSYFAFTDDVSHTVTCCNKAGECIWKVGNPQIIGAPRGITADGDGNVYVVDCKGNRVIILSADGKHHRQVLSVEDGLISPQVVYFETLTNQLLVAKATKTAFLYKVGQ